MKNKLLAIAHGSNIAGWVAVLFTFLTVTSLGKPAFLGFCLAIPLFAVSLKCYNTIALESGIAAKRPPLSIDNKVAPGGNKGCS